MLNDKYRNTWYRLTNGFIGNKKVLLSVCLLLARQRTH